MKNPILLLVAASSLVLPAITHADTPGTKKSAGRQTASTSTTVRPDPNRVIYYINTESATGSHIPRVSRAYHGRIDSASSPAIYGLRQVETTGQLDVGTVLLRLDPSIRLR